MREKKELVKRYIFFFIGIISNALGVAFITRSNLGTGPTTCIPYVASLRFPISFGTFTFAFNMLLLLLQIVLLRKNFKKFQLLQIPVSFVFSACIDAAMFLTRNLHVDFYALCILWTVLGCVLRALGTSCQIIADVVMLSSEAFVKSVADVSKKEFSICKLIIDALMVAIAVGMSFAFFGKLEAIREGTFITVLLVGPVSHWFTKRLRFTNHYLETDGEFVYETKLKLVEGKRLVVTVTSQAGSGGRVIARILGTILNMPVYDKELIDLVAAKGNFSHDFVKNHNERLYLNIAEAFLLENYTLADRSFESYKNLYKAQCDVIKELAQKEDCIIVGHCSNFILRDNPSCVHFFVSADAKHRIEYISEKYRITRKHAERKIRRQDNDTSKYYKHFTGHDWTEVDGYHMALDSTMFGYEGTAELMEQIVKKHYIEVPKVKVRDLMTKYHLESQPKPGLIRKLRRRKLQKQTLPVE